MAENTELKVENSKPLTFSESLQNALIKNSEALPNDFNKARFVQNALAFLNGNDDLRDWISEHKNGVMQAQECLLKGAYLGLDFFNKECYAIPYRDKLTFMVDYRGAEKLCRKYSKRPIKDIYAKIVREGDFFEERIVDGKSTVDFRPLAFNNGKVVGAFAVCLFEDGGIQTDSMSLDELETTRSASKASNSPAWKKFTTEMYKKTVLHRLCKHITLDFDNPSQIQAFYEDSEIETSQKELAKTDIETSVATEVFDTRGVEVE